MNDIRLSVIIPVHNEAANLPELRQRLDEVLQERDETYEIVLVDDGSSDLSFQIMREFGIEDRHYKVVRLRRNYGQTAAIAAGIRNSRGAIIMPMDADLQNDPRDIPLLLEKLEEGWDVVSGWRRERHDPFLSRRLPSLIANWLIGKLTGVKLHDSGCTLKAYRREVIQSASLYGEMHRLMPALARWYGATITEIPVRHNPRTRGKSKYGLARTFKIILDVLTVKFLDSYLSKPIYVFGSFGLGCIALGLITLAYLTYIKIAENAYFIQSPLLLLSSLLCVLGFMSILIGLLAEITVRTYYESQGRLPYSVRETVNLELEGSEERLVPSAR